MMYVRWAPVEMDALSFELGCTTNDLVVLDSMLVTYYYVF